MPRFEWWKKIENEKNNKENYGKLGKGKIRFM